MRIDSIRGASAGSLAAAVVMWALAAGILIAADPAGGVWRFDFGAAADRASIPATLNVTDRYVASRDYAALVQPGWTPIHRWSDYSAEKGFGWLEQENRLDLPYERHAPDNPLFHAVAAEPLYNLIVDGLCSRRGPGTNAPFRIDAKPGSYRITIYFGDLGLGEPRGDMGALVNGQPVFAGIASPGGQVVAESRVVESKEPFLTVTFTIGDRGQTAVSGFTVERVDAAAKQQATVKIPPRHRIRSASATKSRGILAWRKGESMSFSTITPSMQRRSSIRGSTGRRRVSGRV